MRLRLGDPIAATDGHLGHLGDIVVDPVAAKVTHIVVEPEQSRHQDRLVPIWLVSERDGSLVVELDTAHFRQLERVSANDFIRPGETIETEDEWDIGIEEVVHVPYVSAGKSDSWNDNRIEVKYDRIPKGECEIRRASRVSSSDGEMVGHVEAFLADGDDLAAIIVRTGRFGFHRNVLVPFASVARVRMDQVDLALTEQSFSALPRTTSDFPGSTDAAPAVDGLMTFAYRSGGSARRAFRTVRRHAGALWRTGRSKP